MVSSGLSLWACWPNTAVTLTAASPPTPPHPRGAAMPDWLPPWSNVTVRNASVYAACTSKPTLSYVNATLCLSPADEPQASALLGAAIGGGLTGQCTSACVYNPVQPANASSVAAWLFDYDNSCWCASCMHRGVISMWHWGVVQFSGCVLLLVCSSL